MKKLSLAFTLILAALFAVACVAPAAPTENSEPAEPVAAEQDALTDEAAQVPGEVSAVSTVLYDMKNKPVTIHGAPSRVVCLSPAITEVFFELGKQDALVGIGVDCDYPVDTLSVAKVQGIEEIAALNPDMVLVGDDETLYDELIAAGLQAVYVEGETYSDVFSSVAFIGQIMGMDAASLVEKMQLGVQNATAEAGTYAPLSVCYVQSFSGDELITATAEGYIGELITLSGGLTTPTAAEMLKASDPSAVKEAFILHSASELTEMNPDVILVSGAYSLDAFIESGSFATLRAVTQGRVFSVPAAVMDRPGPRIDEAANVIYNALEMSALS